MKGKGGPSSHTSDSGSNLGKQERIAGTTSPASSAGATDGSAHRPSLKPRPPLTTASTSMAALRTLMVDCSARGGADRAAMTATWYGWGASGGSARGSKIGTVVVSTALLAAEAETVEREATGASAGDAAGATERLHKAIPMPDGAEYASVQCGSNSRVAGDNAAGAAVAPIWYLPPPTPTSIPPSPSEDAAQEDHLDILAPDRRANPGDGSLSVDRIFDDVIVLNVRGVGT